MPSRRASITWVAVACFAATACSDAPPRFEAVQFVSDTVMLSGTLYLPTGKGPHPAVVIVHGSGSQTRDPYTPLARVFAEHGVAALTYDKRGTGSSGGSWERSSFQALADDAAAAIAHLRARADVARNAVGVWGGSEGGWIAPLVAARDSLIAFVIVQSAPVVTPAEQHVFQAERLIASRGGSATDIVRAGAYIRAQHRFSATREGWEDYRRMRDENQGTPLAILGGPMEPDDWWWSWWRTKMAIDPVAPWDRIRVPVLALWGDQDDLVPVDASRAALRAALTRAANRDVELEVVSNASHDLEPLGVRRAVTIASRVLGGRPGVTPSMSRMSEWAAQRFVAR